MYTLLAKSKTQMITEILITSDDYYASDLKSLTPIEVEKIYNKVVKGVKS